MTFITQVERMGGDVLVAHELDSTTYYLVRPEKDDTLMVINAAVFNMSEL